MSSKLKKALLIALVFVFAACIGAFLLLRCRITFTDGDSVSTLSALRGSKIDGPEPERPDGLVFAGWQDEDGLIHEPGAIIADDDSKYCALYLIELNGSEHTALIFPDENGFYRLNEYMSRGEFFSILSGFMSSSLPTSVSFSDVSEDAAYYRAASALKSLGIIDGEEFRADEPIYGSELVSILSCFDTAEYNPETVGSGPLTKIEAVKRILSALGRPCAAQVSSELYGAVPDLSPSDPEYPVALEAAIGHEYKELSESGCIWTAHDSFKPLEPGFFLINNRLYYAHEDGSLARNEQIGNLTFGENAEFTSGIAELDALLFSILDDIITEDMDSIAGLKTAYYYVIENCTYLKGNIYEPGETGWAEDEALSMLSTGYGNCYSYAAAFYELARALGYDARIYSGFVSLYNDPHGWVEIEIDGNNYYFDPQLEMSYNLKRDYKIMFMVPEEDVAKWDYDHFN